MLNDPENNEVDEQGAAEQLALSLKREALQAKVKDVVTGFQAVAMQMLSATKALESLSESVKDLEGLMDFEDEGGPAKPKEDEEPNFDEPTEDELEELGDIDEDFDEEDFDEDDFDDEDDDEDEDEDDDDEGDEPEDRGGGGRLAAIRGMKQVAGSCFFPN